MKRTRPEDFLVSIPDEWTGPQAMSVVEFLHELEQAIWEAYERPILDCIHPEAEEPPTDAWPNDADGEE